MKIKITRVYVTSAKCGLGVQDPRHHHHDGVKLIDHVIPMIPKKWMLLAEADPNAADQTMEALGAGFAPPVVAVANDGVDVFDCLYRRGGFRNRLEGPPAVVLLDVNLPVDGWEVLRRIKSDACLNTIPVVIFASSRNEDELARSYQLGASAYVVKPAQLLQLTATLEAIRAFRVVTNELPDHAPCEVSSEMAQLSVD